MRRKCRLNVSSALKPETTKSSGGTYLRVWLRLIQARSLSEAAFARGKAKVPHAELGVLRMVNGGERGALCRFLLGRTVLE